MDVLLSELKEVDEDEELEVDVLPMDSEDEVEE